MTQPGRKRKRLLAPQEKYETWMQLVKGETTIGEAADRSGVDRSTISKLRDVARQGALDALAQSRPGKRAGQRDVELAEARAEAERLRRALAEKASRRSGRSGPVIVYQRISSPHISAVHGSPVRF